MATGTVRMVELSTVQSEATNKIVALTAYFPGGLPDLVNQYLRDGWKLHGAPMQLQYDDQGKIHYEYIQYLKRAD